MSRSENGRRTPPSARRGELLAWARASAAWRRPVDLVDQWVGDGSVRPSPVDFRTTVALDAAALAAAADYEAVLLSPVAPLGAASVVAPTSQDRTLSTIRATEVVSDPTNALALEAAARLRTDPRQTVRLCTVHQTLRMQPVPDAPGHTRHFRLFALADAGPGLPEDGFEVAAVVAQLGAMRGLLDSVSRDLSMRWANPVAIVRTDASMPAVGDRVEAALAAAQPDLQVRREALESGYYQGLRVGFGIHDTRGDFHEWGDLGCFDWVARLTGNHRQRFVASGFGIQLLPLLAGPLEQASR